MKLTDEQLSFFKKLVNDQPALNQHYNPLCIAVDQLLTHILHERKEQAKALAEARKALEWLPIEQAPRDEFLLVASKNGIVYKAEHPKGWAECYWQDEAGQVIVNPTYFQYIPTPPSVKEGV